MSKKNFHLKILKCIECGEEFPFDVHEQEFFDKMGYVDPKRCPHCRYLRKKFMHGGNNNVR